jgi:hypothetical protein
VYIVSGQACTACLRGRLTSNVRPQTVSVAVTPAKSAARLRAVSLNSHERGRAAGHAKAISRPAVPGSLKTVAASRTTLVFESKEMTMSRLCSSRCRRALGTQELGQFVGLPRPKLRRFGWVSALQLQSPDLRGLLRATGGFFTPAPEATSWSEPHRQSVRFALRPNPSLKSRPTPAGSVREGPRPSGISTQQPYAAHLRGRLYLER